MVVGLASIHVRKGVKNNGTDQTLQTHRLICSSAVHIQQIRGLMYSKFSFEEVYRQINGHELSFTATREGSR